MRCLMAWKYLSKCFCEVMDESWRFLKKTSHEWNDWFNVLDDAFWFFIFIDDSIELKMKILNKWNDTILYLSFNKRLKNLRQFFFCEFLISFMVLAKPFWIPGSWVATITASCYASLHSNSVSFVISLLKTIIAYDASWIFFAIFAFPSNVFSF